MGSHHRQLTERFEALVSHYLFEPCFARPREGHDKGGVEARGKGIRLAHLTPIPKGRTLAEISEVLLREMELTFAGEQLFVEERGHLRARPFEARRVELILTPYSQYRRLGPHRGKVHCWETKSLSSLLGASQ
jgi:hypothetical protein